MNNMFRMMVWTLLFAIFGALGCQSDQGLKNRNSNIGVLDEADIEVSREQINFGSLSSGEDAVQSVTVTNVGTEGSVLAVTAVSLTFDGEGAFTITESPDLPIDLRHNESFDFAVQFTASIPEVSFGEIVVASDDNGEGEVFVSLTGEGLMPRLAISPDPLEFGATTVGCPLEDDYTLTNTGNDSLEITEILSDSDYGEFHVLTRPPFPLVLVPGESASVRMLFDPSVGGEKTGEIVVASNDPRGLVRAMQTGSAATVGSNRDTYTVPSAGKIDLLFLVDQSDSMADEQILLGQQAAAFATALGAVTDDWRVAVVTNDSGCMVGDVMDGATPDLPTAFATAVAEGGEREPGYIYTESLVYLAAHAVEQSAAGVCNIGFPRPDALLHVIPVSDELNNSDGLAPEDWRTSLEKMIWHQNASYLVKVSPVVHLDYAGTYLDVAAATFGTPLDLRGAWSDEVDTVAASEIYRSVYPAMGNPDLATLRVYVNGALRLTGWQWREELHAVVITEAVPYTGDLVELVYQVPLECAVEE